MVEDIETGMPQMQTLCTTALLSPQPLLTLLNPLIQGAILEPWEGVVRLPALSISLLTLPLIMSPDSRELCLR